MAGRLETLRFRAMGTACAVSVTMSGEEWLPARRAMNAGRAEVVACELVLSRFDGQSDLSRLNSRSGEWVPVDERLVSALEAALQAREATGGRFDPTILPALVAAGYDRSFELVPAEAGEAPSAVQCGGGVRLTGSRIELDPGVRLDLGGIGKGYAADRAAELLAPAGPCLVNAGGDVSARGGSWPVGVEGAVTLELSDGALATSGRDRRRWRRAGRELHHLIDPATGSPAEVDLLRATAVGSDAVEAEVLAKWLFLAGEAEAVASGIPCVLVTADGCVRLGGGLA